MGLNSYKKVHDIGYYNALTGKEVIIMANIAIIGGGVAGLSAGTYAQMYGHTATIYERRFKAGGKSSLLKRSVPKQCALCLLDRGHIIVRI